MRRPVRISLVIAIVLACAVALGAVTASASGSDVSASGRAVHALAQAAATSTPVAESVNRVPPASTPTAVAESVDRVPPASSEGTQEILPVTGGKADSTMPFVLIVGGASLLLGSLILGYRQKRSK